ncbi:diamine N-acetyltransferase [Nitratireductor aquibiodomus]|uniref:Diamine N-acetyltransferase n=1 Tax=Nitratireductor aquibiodomus TaxID=204799 RepID=A0A1H4LCS0_9HYPH|nr:GNAT family N-acetyltransferase [Nitratireductor aquibiodomus]SEB68539.1 diamine N-acetyltransferase [Nitratireductor aquibiodomus]
MMEEALENTAEITFRRVTSANVSEVCELSETLSDQQREFVADNGTSLAEGFCSESAWFRAIYADECLVGFVMLHEGSDWDDGIDCPGPYLWRFMIARPFQGRGFGRRAIAGVADRLRARGIRELYTSFGLGAGGPQKFYEKLGFVPTGGMFDEEVEVVLALESPRGERVS